MFSLPPLPSFLYLPILPWTFTLHLRASLPLPRFRSLHTHRRAHHYHSVTFPDFGHRSSSLRRRVVCRRRQYHFHVRPSTITSPPLGHFAPIIPVMYYLSPAYKNFAPDLIKGRHLQLISLSSFTWCASYQTVRRQAEPAGLSLVFLVRCFCLPPLFPWTTAMQIATDIYLTPRH